MSFPVERQGSVDVRKTKGGTRPFLKHAKRSILAFFGRALGAVFVKILLRTVTFKPISSNENSPTLGLEPFILAFWHEDQVLMIRPYRELSRLIGSSRAITALTSNHRDGQLIASALRKLGIKVVHGSSSKGGVKALMTLVSAIKRGEDIAITPDGPRGPRRKLKEGVVKIAQLSGAPIVCAGYCATRGLVLGSWDKLKIPAPFSTVFYDFSPPIYVPRVLSKEQFEEARIAIERRLDEIASAVEGRCF